MVRYLFGAGGDGEINSITTGLPYANTAANIYNDRTGGVQVTDLQNVSGTTVTQATSDAFGQFAFYGPDNYTSSLWLDLGSGPRWAMRPVDIAGIATTAATANTITTITTTRASDYTNRIFTTKASLPKNTNDPLESALADTLDPLVIPRIAFANRGNSFPSPAAGDRYYDTTFAKTFRHDGTNWLTVDMSTWGTLALTWSSTGTAPVLNNATSGIRYYVDGKQVSATFRLVAGSTTTFGTGLYTFNLPITASSNAIGALGTAVLTQGSTRWGGVCQVTATGTLTMYLSTSSANPQLTQWGATVPATFANGNVMDASITYESA